MGRFEYAKFSSREKAEAALEHMFAAGEVSESESPTIEYRRGAYFITLLGV